MKISTTCLILIFLSLENFTSLAQTNNFPPSGNASIATTDPYMGNSTLSTTARYLTIVGNGTESPTSTGRLILGSNRPTPTAGDQTGGIIFQSQNISSSAAYKVTGAIGTYLEGTGGWAGQGSYMNFSTKEDNGGAAERMRIASNGNMGIGTTNPLSLLHLTSATVPRIQLTRQGILNWYIGNPSTGTSNDLSIGTDAGNQMSILNLTAFGDVGIGTTTPKEKLSVNGKIRAQEIKVETQNWPDYVFEEDYQPTSLQETEAFIKANKHLPEMPSEAEVKAEGISLGEMNAKLLKKIEELTLHLIEQNKRLDIQNKELKAQSQKLESQQKEIEQLKTK